MGIKNITGQTFNKLTALNIDHISKKGAVWLCQCECGNYTKCLCAELTRQGVKSCGCLKTLPVGEAAFNSLYDQYQRNAKSMGRDFLLTKSEFKSLTQSDCIYCGVSPSSIRKIHRGKTSYIYNGIDRKDNTIGYVLNNCVPCCSVCNHAKSNMSYDAWVKWLKRIAHHNA